MDIWILPFNLQHLQSQGRAFLRLLGQWWGKLDENNISYKNSSKDVIMNTSIVA